MNNYNFIFDFDGTLVDSIPTFLAAADKLASHNNLKTKTVTHQVENPDTDNPIKKSIISFIFDRYHIPWYKLPWLALQYRTILNQNIHTIKVFPEIKNILTFLKSNQFRLILLSSSPSYIANYNLKRLGLESFFEEITTGVSVLHKGKEISKLLRAKQLDPASSFYIGDEARDIYAAKQAGIKSIAVGWGFGVLSDLHSQHPDHSFETIPEFENFIRQIK